MSGITGTTRNSVALSVLPHTPPGELWRYGGGGPFQVAPRLAGFFCTIWVEGRGNRWGGVPGHRARSPEMEDASSRLGHRW